MWFLRTSFLCVDEKRYSSHDCSDPCFFQTSTTNASQCIILECLCTVWVYFSNVELGLRLKSRNAKTFLQTFTSLLQQSSLVQQKAGLQVDIILTSHNNHMMGASLVGIVVGAAIAVTILCVALFFALRYLRRRRRGVIDEETSTISSQSTASTEGDSSSNSEEPVVDHWEICRRVVPCFASAEYEGPATRAGKFIYGGSLLDNVQQPSAEDLARAGYEPIVTAVKREIAPDRRVLRHDKPQAGHIQAKSTGEDSFEVSNPASTSTDRASIVAQPRPGRPLLQRANAFSSLAGHPQTQRYRSESYDRTLRHRSWIPSHTAQPRRATAEPAHDLRESRHSLNMNLTLPEIRRLPTLRMPDRI